MEQPNPDKLPTIIDSTVMIRELKSLRKLLDHPFTQATMDEWLDASVDRRSIFQDTFWGSIRWPKSLGRSTAKTLSEGFSFTLRAHHVTWVVGPGGELIPTAWWADMPPPNSWDAPDDADHYRVNYSGYYFPLSVYTNKNGVKVTIAGSWTSPSEFGPRILLPDPSGYMLGSYDGSPIFLGDTTVESHLLQPVPVWSIKL